VCEFYTRECWRAALCQGAANIVNQSQMKEEAGSDYDLNKLSGLPMKSPEEAEEE
jgi:hypothetical protein